MNNNRIHAKHKVYNVSYHIVWIPKYRKKLLNNAVAEELKKCLFEKAIQIGIKIEAYEIMIDHIHLFVKANTNITISFIVQQLKGYSSYVIRKKFVKLKTYKSLWTHSYFVETIGSTNEEAIKKYIENQKNK